MERRDFLKAGALAPVAVATPGLLDLAHGATGDPSLATGAAVGARPALPVVRIPVITRAAWGARPPRPMERHVPRRLTLHHTAVRMTPQRPEGAELRGIQAWHQRVKGHDDIDYHFLVDRTGHVFEGRNVHFRGDTATEYDPTGHFLVCCMGDFEGISSPPQRPTRALVRSVALLFAWASQRWDIPVRRLGGHRDYAQTTCPGDELYELIRDGMLARRITAITSSRTVALERLPKARGRRILARIDA